MEKSRNPNSLMAQIIDFFDGAGGEPMQIDPLTERARLTEHKTVWPPHPKGTVSPEAKKIISDRAKERYAKNKDAIREKNRLAYQKNKVKHKKWALENYQANKEELKARSRAEYQKNKMKRGLQL